MKHKTIILIPFKNSSARLRCKNEFLLHFTLAWLQGELASLDLDGVRVHTYGNIDTATRKWLASLGVEHVKLSHNEDTGHHAATLAALSHLGAGAQDKIIML